MCLSQAFVDEYLQSGVSVGHVSSAVCKYDRKGVCVLCDFVSHGFVRGTVMLDMSL